MDDKLHRQLSCDILPSKCTTAPIQKESDTFILYFYGICSHRECQSVIIPPPLCISQAHITHVVTRQQCVQMLPLVVLVSFINVLFGLGRFDIKKKNSPKSIVKNLCDFCNQNIS